MTAAPKWLSEYLDTKLPELAALAAVSPDSPEAAAIHRWFDQLLEHFQSRGLSTPYQQRNRLVDARNAIKTRFGQNHPALAIVNFSKETWWEINSREPVNPRPPKTIATQLHMKPTTTDSDASPALEAAPGAAPTADPAQASAPAAGLSQPTAAEIQAKLDQVKERRTALQATYDTENSQLAKQQARLAEIKAQVQARAEGKPAPVAPSASVLPPAPAPESLASVTPAVATTEPIRQAKGPGLFSRLAAKLKKLTGRKLKTGPAVKADRTAPEPVNRGGTLSTAADEKKDAPEAAESKALDMGKPGEASTPHAAGSEATDSSLLDQINEVMREIQAIEERLNQMEAQIRAMDQEILGLEARLLEAKRREAVTSEAHTNSEGETVPTVPIPRHADGVTPPAGSATPASFGKAELTQVEETARREMANELRQGESVVLKGDYARLVRLDPDSFRVTDCGCEVIDGEAVPIFRLDAVLDPDTKEWVEARQPAEVVLVEENAVVGEAPAEMAAARKGRGR